MGVRQSQATAWRLTIWNALTWIKSLGRACGLLRLWVLVIWLGFRVPLKGHKGSISDLGALGFLYRDP